MEVESVTEMNLNHLLYFNTIVECGNINQASKKLFISQPALTISVKKLEEELGIPLFVRTDKKMLLNQYGRCLYEISQEILSLANSIPTKLKALDTHHIPHLVMESAYQYFIPFFHEKIIETLGDIPFEGNINFEPSLDRLISEECDLILSYGETGALNANELLDSGIEYLYLYQESLYLAAPHGHPLAQNKFLFLKDLNHQSLVRTLDFTNLNHWLNKLHAQKRLEIKYPYTVDGKVLIDKMGSIKYPYLTSSLYISMPQKYPIFTQQRTLLRIADPEASRGVYLFYLKKRKNILQKYIDIFLNCFYEQYDYHTVL